MKRQSDYNPLLLRCGHQVSSRDGRPFRFQAAWCTHQGYKLLVNMAWKKHDDNVVTQLDEVKKESIKFNKEQFGNIFAKKKQLEAKMKGSQRTMESVDSASLIILQKELLQEYKGILFQEETLWCQKSRENWIKLGSRNTAFFHAQTVVRRKRNKIHGLHISSGAWCTGQDVLKEEAVKYYKDLFGTRDIVCEDLYGVPSIVLNGEEKASLIKTVIKDEAYKALISMKSYQAPGSDGFQPILFKMFWKEVGDDVWRFVKKTMEEGRLEPGTTDTLIVLIQKGDHPNSFKDSRPISLCNVIYKLVTKVLVNRLHPILSRIVSPLHSSFIPGRSTRDNAIVLQDVVHHMRTKKRKVGDLVLKLYLEKAYDRVDWRFLRRTLELFGFPEVIISLIMHGILSSSISLLWNGSRTDGFAPMRGLRQGDPLSLYLFVLCMERLGEMILKEVGIGNWLPVQVSKNGPKFFHLFFADDVLLFAKAKVSQARLIGGVLEKFCGMSGLKLACPNLSYLPLRVCLIERKRRLQLQPPLDSPQTWRSI